MGISYTNLFSGSPVENVISTYNNIVVTNSTPNISLVIDTSFSSNSNTFFARIMEVEPLVENFVLSLPNATFFSLGADILVTNKGVYSFTLQSFNGVFSQVIIPGEAQYFYLTDNSTADGSWGYSPFGEGFEAGLITVDFIPATSSIVINPPTIPTTSPFQNTVSIGVGDQLLQLATFSASTGLVTYYNNAPTFKGYSTNTLTNSDGNIIISNGDGGTVADPIVINLSTSLTFTNLTVASDITITGICQTNTYYDLINTPIFIGYFSQADPVGTNFTWTQPGWTVTVTAHSSGGNTILEFTLPNSRQVDINYPILIEICSLKNYSGEDINNTMYVEREDVLGSSSKDKYYIYGYDSGSEQEDAFIIHAYMPYYFSGS